MGWKCTPQVTGLVKGEPKQGQKHRSNAKAIIIEAGKERVSKSDTLDRDRTKFNKYYGFDSGFKCTDYITEEAENYRQEVVGKGGTKHLRKLRSDAVIGYAIIYNPPEEICSGWSDAEYEKFYADSRKTMEQICPDVFRSDTIVMSAEHFDEGTITDITKISRHVHDIGIPRDRDGHYCGNKIDSKLCVEINANYPRLMREKGWDIDDLDVTDWDKYKTDKEYREERKSKQQSGKSVNEYIASKMRRQIQKNEDMAVTLQTAISEALELAEDKDRLEQEREQIEAEKERLRLEREEVSKQKGDLFRAKIAQERKEKEFQRLEDSLGAQKRALEKEKVDSQREVMRYKLSLKSKYEGECRKYKGNCEKRMYEMSKKINEMPTLSEVVENAMDNAYVPMRMGADMPLRQFIQRQQRSRAMDVSDFPEVPRFDDDFGMNIY